MSSDDKLNLRRNESPETLSFHPSDPPPDNKLEAEDKAVETSFKDSASAEKVAAAEHSTNPVRDRILGTIFEGKYRIRSLLGEGGMSFVYLAHHEALNKLYAIKTLQTHLAAKTSSQLRFRQEAQAISALTHPSIVGMHDYGLTEDGTPYLVMDYIDGQSLSAYLDKHNQLPVAEAERVFTQCASAIEHAHRRGVIHRDIKPSNIMLYQEPGTEGLNAKIVDFGVAKLAQPELSTKLTQTGESVGSPLYMSPEQCLGQDLDVRSDIYSFGCVMYESLTGRAAFSSDSVFGTMMKQMHEHAPSFKSVNVKGAEALERIVFKALAKDPSKRYQSMSALQRDLETFSKKRGPLESLLDRFELTALQTSSKTAKLLFCTVLILVVGLTALVALIGQEIGRIKTAPNLMAEKPIWAAFADTQSNRNRSVDVDRSQILDLGEQVFLKAETKTPRRGEAQISRAKSLRNQNEYDSAKVQFDDAIKTLRTELQPNAEDLTSTNRKRYLCEGFLGRADCEYFSSPPQFEAAGADYRQAFELYKLMRHDHTTFFEPEQVRAVMRWADCYYQLHRDKEAIRLIERVLDQSSSPKNTPIYYDLAHCKLAEMYFQASLNANDSDRAELLRRARQHFEETLTGAVPWEAIGGQQHDLALTYGRLAEIGIATGSDPTKYFSNFMNNRSWLGLNDDAIKTFSADVLQSYAAYLWSKGHYADAYQINHESEMVKPR